MIATLTALLLLTPVHVQGDPCVAKSPNLSAAFSSAAPPGRFLVVAADAEPVAPSGWRFDDVEVARVGAAKTVGVLLRPGDPAATELVQATGAQAFAALVGEKQKSGRCLLGFEAWREGGEQRFAGVFGGACGDQLFHVGLDLVGFSALLESMKASHRLVDFETTLAAGQPTFSALFRPAGDGQPADGQVYSLLHASYETFHEQAHLLREIGFQLVDFDIEIKPELEMLGPGELASKPEGAPAVWRRMVRDSPCGDGPEPDVAAAFSAVWRRAATKDWLGVDYHLDQFHCAAKSLPDGAGVSGLHPDTGVALCDQEDWSPSLDQAPLHLLAVEMHAPLVLNCCAFHGLPLHDSGTADPP